MIAHVMGVPIEETVLQLAPAGAAMMTLVAFAARTGFGRLRRRLDHAPPREETPSPAALTPER